MFVSAPALVHRLAPEIRCPVIVVHSLTDSVTSASRSLEWLQLTRSSDATYVAVESGLHNLWWEPVDLRIRLLERLLTFLREHSDSRPAVDSADVHLGGLCRPKIESMAPGSGPFSLPRTGASADSASGVAGSTVTPIAE